MRSPIRTHRALGIQPTTVRAGRSRGDPADRRGQRALRRG
jgi:hypothetical protein